MQDIWKPARNAMLLGKGRSVVAAASLNCHLDASRRGVEGASAGYQQCLGAIGKHILDGTVSVLLDSAVLWYV